MGQTKRTGEQPSGGIEEVKEHRSPTVIVARGSGLGVPFAQLLLCSFKFMWIRLSAVLCHVAAFNPCLYIQGNADRDTLTFFSS